MFPWQRDWRRFRALRKCYAYWKLLVCPAIFRVDFRRNLYCRYRRIFWAPELSFAPMPSIAPRLPSILNVIPSGDSPWISLEVFRQVIEATGRRFDRHLRQYPAVLLQGGLNVGQEDRTARQEPRRFV